MNNRLLNINGESKELLKLALNVAFNQDLTTKNDIVPVQSWIESHEHGLILLWTQSSELAELATSFMSPMTFDTMCNMVWDWYTQNDPDKFKLEHWEHDADHDGFNKKGWRVYVNDWGNVGNYSCVTCAIKPIYLWLGK